MTKTKYTIALVMLAIIGIVVSYPYALRYVAGYLDMTVWANLQTTTNLTVGVVGMFIAFGGVLGYFLPKKVYYKFTLPRRKLATMCTTAVLVMLFCYMLSIAGVPGFRFN